MQDYAIFALNKYNRYYTMQDLQSGNYIPYSINYTNTITEDFYKNIVNFAQKNLKEEYAKRYIGNIFSSQKLLKNLNRSYSRYAHKHFYLGNVYAKDKKELERKFVINYAQKSNTQKKFFYNKVTTYYNKRTKQAVVKPNTELIENYLKDLEAVNGNIIYRTELLTGEYLEQKDKEYAYRKIAKVYYLNYINRHKHAYFITFTLPSIYHFYKFDLENVDNKEDIKDKSKRKRIEHVKNDKCMFNTLEQSIEEGLFMLNVIYRSFYLRVKKLIANNNKSMYRKRAKKVITYLENKKGKKLTKNKKEKIRKKFKEKVENKYKDDLDFIKIIEPHESYTPHMHILIFIENYNKKFIEQAFVDTIKKYNLDIRFNKVEEIDEDIASVSTYVSKYILKMFNTKEDVEEDEQIAKKLGLKSDELDDKIFLYYRRYFASKHKLFTTSNFKYTTQEKINIMYRYIKTNKPKLLEQLKRKQIPIYYFLERLEQIGIFKFTTVQEETIKLDKQKLEQLVEKQEQEITKEEVVEFAQEQLSIDIETKEMLENIDINNNLYKYYKAKASYYKALKIAIDNMRDYLKVVKVKKVSKAYYKPIYDYKNSKYIEIYDKNDIEEYANYFKINDFISKYAIYSNVNFTILNYNAKLLKYKYDKRFYVNVFKKYNINVQEVRKIAV